MRLNVGNRLTGAGHHIDIVAFMTNDMARNPAHDAAARPGMGGLAGRVSWDSPLRARPAEEVIQWTITKTVWWRWRPRRGLQRLYRGAVWRSLTGRPNATEADGESPDPKRSGPFFFGRAHPRQHFPPGSGYWARLLGLRRLPLGMSSRIVPRCSTYAALDPRLLAILSCWSPRRGRRTSPRTASLAGTTPARPRAAG